MPFLLSWRFLLDAFLLRHGAPAMRRRSRFVDTRHRRRAFGCAYSSAARRCQRAMLMMREREMRAVYALMLF